MADCKNAASPRTGEVRPVRMDRKSAARYLEDHHGITIAPGTLAKMACRGDGPVFTRFDGRRVLYAVADLDAWVETRLSAPMRSTSEEG